MVMNINEQIEKLTEFISENYKDEIYESIQKGKKALIIDFKELARFDHELAEDLLQVPEEIIKASEIALNQIDLPEENTLRRIRFRNLPQTQKIKIANIRSSHLDKFVSVEGIVRQASDIRPQVTQATFECPSCGNSIKILQITQTFKEPSRCSCGRKGASAFKLISKEMIDVQHLKIEEAPESLDGGEQPKRLSIFAKEDLVEPQIVKKTTPGSRILVNGAIKEVETQLRTGVKSVRFDIIMEANNIEATQEDFSEVVLTRKDEEEIENFAKNPKLYETIANSIAPSIYGYELIKLALTLQLVGGVRKLKEDGTITRGDIHILLIGDPGSGKSQILQFIAKNAPKARFVSGKGSSGAGLTASVIKDEFLRGWSLEAGALVLANKGLAVVDELDKMAPEDRSALHEALEQQQVTISKANIQASLRAETTLLAAANPKGSRFDPYTPIPQQIDLPPTLLNRFDLIFPIRDIPNKDRDEEIATHVLETTQKKESYKDNVPSVFLKKYISYVKQRIKPELTKQAIEEIKDFYVNLRNSPSSGDIQAVKPIPISARQLEGLIRLTEASAKLRLDTRASKDDAKRAISLLTYCLNQVGIDPETGQIDMDRISGTTTASSRNKIIIVKEIIKILEDAGLKTITIEEIFAKAHERGLKEDKIEETIEQLKKSGEIFEAKKGFIQRI